MRFDGGTTTWGELDERIRRNANGQLKAGLRPGDRVAFLDKNHPACLETTFACAQIGTVNAAVNFRLAPEELAYVINESQARLLFVGPEFLPVVDQLDLPKVERIIVDYEDFLADDGEISHEPAAGDTFLQLYTSGTTGYPKGVMLTHRAMTAHSRNTNALGFTRDSKVMVPMPLFHAGGISWALGALWAGAEITIIREVVPSAMVEQFRHVTHTFLVPAVIGFLLDVPGEITGIKNIAYGGSPIPTPLLRKALERFPVDFYQIYGMTEACGMFCLLGPEDHHQPSLQSSGGRPVDGVELRIVDPVSGEPVPVGELGQIQVRTEQVMAGYWQHPAETAATLVDGWLNTGDAGRVNAEGYVFVEDRVKDMIISGGENIYPAEIERVLGGHPAVKEVAVIGVPDDKWGETVKAIVVADGDLDPAALIAYSRSRLAGYKAPTSVDFVEELPRNATGKILKRSLRAPYWANRERSV